MQSNFLSRPGLVPGQCSFKRCLDAPLRTLRVLSRQPLSRRAVHRGHLRPACTHPPAREATFAGYTDRRDIKRLVWFERHDDIEVAIQREKTIKRWPRQWKFNVIEEGNPDWLDLAEEFGFPPLSAK